MPSQNIGSSLELGKELRGSLRAEERKERKNRKKNGFEILEARRRAEKSVTQWSTQWRKSKSSCVQVSVVPVFAWTLSVQRSSTDLRDTQWCSPHSLSIAVLGSTASSACTLFHFLTDWLNCDSISKRGGGLHNNEEKDPEGGEEEEGEEKRKRKRKRKMPRAPSISSSSYFTTRRVI